MTAEPFRVLEARMSIPDKNWQPPFVSLDTSMGEITVELYWQHAPITCRSPAGKCTETQALCTKSQLFL
jgi:hypothetical protein